jgi:serine/threonine-protein kinase
VQVAEALEAVHDKGIIHRDLKPANIKLTAEATVKVLDFGLAKIAGESAEHHSRLATMTFSGTGRGVIVGTAAYMSPEQARGADVDRRTDVWSFGCVLYEMLTGRAAFAAATVADTIGAVMTREPDWAALPSATPPAVVRVVRRCLQRDVKQRLRDIGDARLDLEDAAEDDSPARLAKSGAGAARAAIVGVVGLGAGLLVGALVARSWSAVAPPNTEPARFAVTLPSTTPLGGLDFPSLAMSPNGSHLVYVGTRGGQTQLFLRPLNAVEPAAIAGTLNAVAPFFSADGEWIGFFSDGQLRKVALSGGMPITVCDAPIGLGGSWNASGMILFAAGTGSALFLVPASGGTPQRVTTLDIDKGEFSHRWPEWLPDGETFLYTVGTTGSWNDAQIVAQSRNGPRTVLAQRGTNPHYLPTGHLLFAQNGRIMRVGFDAGRVATSGTPEPVLDGVMQSSDGAAQIAISRSGHAVYVAGTLESGQRRLMSVGRDGSAIPFAAPPGMYASPRVSPDGQRLLLTVETSPPDLWRYDIETGVSVQLTFNAGATSPIWSRDGQQAAFSSTKSGAPNVFVMSMQKPGAAERIVPSDHPQVPGSWTPEDAALAFVERRPDTGRDILLVPLRDRRSPSPLLTSLVDESTPRISPDGRWVVYVTNDGGRSAVHLRMLAGARDPQRVSTGGGAEPVWASTGREFFYRDGGKVMAVPVDEDGAGQPRTIFEGDFAPGTIDSPNYDVMPDGQRFVMLQKPLPSASQSTLQVLMNWFETPPGGSAP